MGLVKYFWAEVWCEGVKIEVVQASVMCYQPPKELIFVAITQSQSGPRPKEEARGPEYHIFIHNFLQTKYLNIIVSSLLSVSKLNHRQHFSTICAKHHLLCPPKRGNLPKVRGVEEGPDFAFLQEMNFVFLSWLSFVYCSGEYETGARWGTSVSCSPKHSPPKQIMPTCCRNRGRPSVNERGFYEYLSRVFE